MNYVARPGNAPPCWGLQFEDGNRECMQCSAKDSCRPATMNAVMAQQQQIPMIPRMTLPVPVPPPPAPMYQVPQMPAIPQAPQQPYRLPVVPQQAPQPFQGYQVPAPAPAPQPWHMPIPDPRHPDPAAPMYRPGAVGGGPYYFNQYQGETVPQRLAKNMFLRAAEAVFSEVANFFRHWTMPPKR